jgi:hypothetical protein
MPIGINSPARNLFLLGSSGSQLVTNFFKLIDQSLTTNNSYVPAEIKYNESDDRYLLSGTALDTNLVPNKGFGWFEKRDNAGTAEWGVRVEAPSAGVNTTLRAMELDSNDNLIVVGKTGDVPWIAKYSNGGVIDWQSTTNSGDVEYTGVTSDSNGQYYACGNTPTSGEAQAFVEKFDANGNPGWGKSAFMLGRDVVLTKIDANDRGEVVAVGYLEDDTANKGYIIKIDTNTGEVLWDRTLSSQDTTFPLGVLNVKATNVKIDDKGQIYVVGTVLRNSFVIKYTAEGNMIWQKETNLPVGASAPDIQHVGLTVNSVTESVTVASYYFALGADEIYLSNYNKKGDLVWRRSIDQGSSVLSNPSLDNEGAFIYFLFDAGSNTDATYTYGKLSTTGNGLGDFQYNDGTATLIDYQYVGTGFIASDVIGKISDGSVRNDTSDLITYPFNANKLLFDDLATQVSNKKRQMDSADSFEYSGSPAIRPADFQELNLLGDVYSGSGDWLDQSGKGNDGVVNGATYNAAGYWEFDGTNGDKITVGSIGDWNFLHNGSTDWTMEYWIYVDLLSDRRTIFSTGGNSSVVGISSRVMESGALGSSDGTLISVQISRGVGGNYLYWDSSPSNITNNTWYHISLVFNSSSKSLGIYLNSQLTNGSSDTGAVAGTFGSGDYSQSNSYSNLEFGGDSFTGSSVDFDGRIGEVRIYPRALTAAQVFQNYNATREKYTGVPASTDPGLTSTRTPA